MPKKFVPILSAVVLVVFAAILMLVLQNNGEDPADSTASPSPDPSSSSIPSPTAGISAPSVSAPLESLNRLLGTALDDSASVSNQEYYALAQDLLSPDSSGSFPNFVKPVTLLNRQDAYALPGMLLGLHSSASLEFADVDDIADYALPYIAWFAERGYISGDREAFTPGDALHPREWAQILLYAYEYQGLNQTQTALLAGGQEGSTLLFPQCIFMGPDDNPWILDTYNNMIRRLEKGVLFTVTGSIQALDQQRFPKGYYRDGALDYALFNRPSAAVTLPDGSVLVADAANHCIRQIKDGVVTCYAGGTESGYAGGFRTEARFAYPCALALGADGTLYIADALSHLIRSITPEGMVTDIAGMTDIPGYRDSADGAALFRNPTGIAVAPDGSLYIADSGNHRIRKIQDSTVTTAAGFTDEEDEDGAPLGGFAVGNAAEARFTNPAGLAFAGDYLLIADSGNHMVRALTPEGRVVALCGTGSPGDSLGGALDTMLCSPSGVYYDQSSKLLYIADTGNGKIKTMPFDPAEFAAQIDH